MLHIYTFIDNDNIDTLYTLLTKDDCTKLLHDIERFYYDFDYYDNIEELTQFLSLHNVDSRLVSYVSHYEEIEDVTLDGIAQFTNDILEYYDLLLAHEHTIIHY